MFSSPCGVWLAGGQGHDLPPTPGDIWLPVSPIPVVSNSWHTEMQRASRGPPWLLSAHDRQIYGAHHRWIEDFILCCGLVPDPPASSACPLSFDTGHTCTSTHAFASGLLQMRLAADILAIGYPSPPSGWVWTLLGTCVTIPGITN